MTQTGLRVSDLRKSFDAPGGARTDVLRGVSFSVAAGEAVAVMGASGAGKSTLLHVLAGLDEADHGQINIAGFEISEAAVGEAARFRRQHVGMIFQFHHLLKDLTASENVSLPLLIQRNNGRAATLRSTALLEHAGLAERLNYLVSDLSGGEQQRVAVCRALISNPKLVLADEPTGNVDTATGESITRSLISHAKENGAIVVIATHSAAVAGQCDRTLLLSDGRMS